MVKRNVLRSEVNLHRLSFTVCLPAIVIAGCLMEVVFPAVRVDLGLRNIAGTAPSVRVNVGEFTMVIRKDRFFSFGFERASYTAQGVIVALNMPAAFVATLVARVVAQGPRWSPAGLMPWEWIAITYPLYALPAWIFIGWALDILIKGKRMPSWIGWASLALSCGCAILAIGFRFGFTDAERQGQDLLGAYTAGFILWAVLLTLPFVAQMRWIPPTQRPI